MNINTSDMGRRNVNVIWDTLGIRRSVRKYLPDKTLSGKTIQTLVEAALLTPSANNSHSTKIMVVSNKEVLEKLSRVKEETSAFLKNAALGVVILGDPAKSKIWRENAALTAFSIQLAAVAEKLGSCWIHTLYDDRPEREKYVKDILSIPEPLRALAIISIGYPAPDETLSPRTPPVGELLKTHVSYVA